jgi:ribose 5-phosphate isomerase B
MKIAIAADHRGTEVWRHLRRLLTQEGLEIVELLNCDGKPCDFPDMAYPIAKAVADGVVDRGILICGTGIGMSIAANKVPGVRAALVHDEIGADLSRRHVDANILCLSADMLGFKIIDRIVKTWFATDFEGGRHARRVDKIHAIEGGRHPAVIKDAHPPPSPPEKNGGHPPKHRTAVAIPIAP